MNITRKLSAFIFGLVLISVAADVQAQIPQKAEYGKYAITGADIYTVTNGVIEGGVILINGNEIEHVGQNVRIDDSYERINASGKRIYPGMIDSGTRLGLREISQVPVTIDDAELGDFNPQVEAAAAINPSSVPIPVTRVNGVTTVISHPTSGVVSGKSTLIDLYGYNVDSMAVRKNAALQVEWPSSTPGGWWDDRSEEEVREEYLEELDELNDFWEEAKAYHRMWTSWEENEPDGDQPDKNYTLESMREVVSGELPVMISVDHADDILEALEWIEDRGEEKPFILSSVAEGWRVADEIAEADIPVLVGPALRTASRGYDNYQRPYQNAGKLHDAGVEIAVRTGETENVRNLPYNAGYFATYGLGKEEALEAVTINPARIFGVDDQIGSLEEGKRANLFIADGDPFETLTQIEQVFIDGFKIPMTNKQIKLYQEYKERDVRAD